MAKNLIDFRILNSRQLTDLSEKWEREAYSVEMKIENNRNDNEREEKLRQVANSLWRRLKILEDWRNRNAKRIGVK